MTGNPRLSQVVQNAERLGEQLAHRAAGVDEGRLDARDSFELAKDGGFLRMLVPIAHGGDGLSFLECTKVLETIAKYDAPTALGLNMHNVAVGSVCENAELAVNTVADEFRTWMFKQIVSESKMFASATSEPGTGAKLRAIKTVYRRVRSGSGYILSGTKSFVSLAGIANFFVVAARAEDASSTDEVSHFVVSEEDSGVVFGEVWQGTAMRGTCTADMHLHEVEIPQSRLFMRVEGMSLFKLVREPHWMVAGYTGVYAGLAQALLQAITDIVGTRQTTAASIVMVSEVGRLAVIVKAARSLLYAACSEVDAARGSTGTNASVHAAKYMASEALAQLTAAAPRLCGTSAVARHPILDRLLREAPFCAVMPAQPNECLEYVGKAQLGANLYDISSFEW